MTEQEVREWKADEAKANRLRATLTPDKRAVLTLIYERRCGLTFGEIQAGTGLDMHRIYGIVSNYLRHDVLKERRPYADTAWQRRYFYSGRFGGAAILGE